MNAANKEYEIARLIVAFVLVIVVDVVSIGDGPTVIIFPDHPMQTDSIALEIFPAQVVAKSLKLLNCRRDDRDWHVLVRLMLCDTAS